MRERGEKRSEKDSWIEGGRKSGREDVSGEERHSEQKRWSEMKHLADARARCADGQFPKRIPDRRTVFSGLCFVSSAVDKTTKCIEMCLTHGGGTFEAMPDAASASEWKKGGDVSKVFFVWEHNVTPDVEALKAFQVLQLRYAGSFSLT